MLPPRLKQIRESLLERRMRGFPVLTVDEEQLLSELDFLDEDARVQQTFRENRDLVTKIVSGPSDRCPCCGR